MKQFMMSFGVLCLAANAVQAAVIVQTDFNSAAIGSYNNNAVINNETVATTDDFKVVQSDPLNVIAVSDQSGNRVLDGSNVTNSGVRLVANRKSDGNTAWNSVSTLAAGNNRIIGSVDFTHLLSTGGIRFHLASGADTSSGSNSIVQIELESNGLLRGRHATG